MKAHVFALGNRLILIVFVVLNVVLILRYGKEIE